MTDNKIILNDWAMVNVVTDDVTLKKFFNTDKKIGFWWKDILYATTRILTIMRLISLTNILEWNFINKTPTDKILAI